MLNVHIQNGAFRWVWWADAVRPDIEKWDQRRKWLRHNYEYSLNKTFNDACTSLQRVSGNQSCMRKMNFPSSQGLTGTLDISKPHKQIWKESRKLRHTCPWSQSWEGIHFLAYNFTKSHMTKDITSHAISLLCQNLIQQVSHLCWQGTKRKCTKCHVNHTQTRRNYKLFRHCLSKAHNHSKMCKPRYLKEN